MYADHIEQHGEALFQRVCELDLEGVVAKLKSGPYVSEREHSTWRKILNPNYSQRVGRDELFERERHKEPVPGWHACTVACAELEEMALAKEMPSRRRSSDVARIRASTDTKCPHCGALIEPKDYKRVDWEHLECPQCGVRFIPRVGNRLES